MDELAAQRATRLANEIASASTAHAEARTTRLTHALAAAREELAAAGRCEDEALKQLVLAPLFPELISAIFALLPVDSRLRCREVSRGWRAFLADPRLWRICDLDGVTRRSPALLRAASEQAQGTLEVLDVSAWYGVPVGEGEMALNDGQLLPVLRANAASLLELRAWTTRGSAVRTSARAATVEQILVAAPRLRLLECDAYLEGEEARGPVPRLLREPQFAPLRLRVLAINSLNMRPPLDVPALVSCAAKHSSLEGLLLCGALLDNQPALNAVASLATMQLHQLILYGCRLSPASLPALTQMLESRALTVLRIYSLGAPLLMGAAVPAFCAALRASRLVELELCVMRLWESLADGMAVIAACTDHPTLREISFEFNDLNVPGRAAIEAALDALQASIPGNSLTR